LKDVALQKRVEDACAGAKKCASRTEQILRWLDARACARPRHAAISTARPHARLPRANGHGPEDLSLRGGGPRRYNAGLPIHLSGSRTTTMRNEITFSPLCEEIADKATRPSPRQQRPSQTRQIRKRQESNWDHCGADCAAAAS